MPDSLAEVPEVLPHALFVDHTAEPGGGELALLRFLRLTNLKYDLVLLGTGLLTDEFRSVSPTMRVPRRHLGLIGQVRFLHNAIVSLSPDIVVVNSLRSAVVAAVALPRRIPLAVFLRDGLDAKSLSLPKRLVSWVALMRARLLLSNSEWTTATLPRPLRGRAHTVYTLSGTPAPSAELPPRGWQPGGPLRLVFVGRLSPWKGVHVLLDAVQLAEEARPNLTLALRVVGGSVMADPEYAKRLRQRASLLRSPVDFTGHVGDVRAELDGADVLVHCSTRPEPFGQVIVQALDRGLAVVATRGGPDEILVGELSSGLVRGGDAAAIASRLVELADEGDPHGHWAEVATLRARHFSDTLSVDRVEAAIVALAAVVNGVRGAM